MMNAKFDIRRKNLWFKSTSKLTIRVCISLKFLRKDLNCVGNSFKGSQKLKTWHELKQEYSFHENKGFYLCSN